uniref:AlNc14C56G4264 protein n=1 Tax=Albugo laibachii Nc14 TaxID=890382 RepID=F0WC81_9STRA|nr:AlNc14C56G4264 [Albugo laibachii Nc14]|eukprot:CCA18794.1 AlNc14C56G4264 [Albugo laibachii Nc14]
MLSPPVLLLLSVVALRIDHVESRNALRIESETATNAYVESPDLTTGKSHLGFMTTLSSRKSNAHHTEHSSRDSKHGSVNALAFERVLTEPDTDWTAAEAIARAEEIVQFHNNKYGIPYPTSVPTFQEHQRLATLDQQQMLAASTIRAHERESGPSTSKPPRPPVKKRSKK